MYLPMNCVCFHSKITRGRPNKNFLHYNETEDPSALSQEGEEVGCSVHQGRQGEGRSVWTEGL